MIRMFNFLKKDFLNQLSLSLVAEAEKEFGGKTGELKYATVTVKIYEKLPWYAKLFLTPSRINRLIEQAVATLNKKLNK